MYSCRKRTHYYNNIKLILSGIISVEFKKINHWQENLSCENDALKRFSAVSSDASGTQLEITSTCIQQYTVMLIVKRYLYTSLSLLILLTC